MEQPFRFSLVCLATASLLVACGEPTPPDSTESEPGTQIPHQSKEFPQVAGESFQPEPLPNVPEYESSFQNKLDAALAENASMEDLTEVVMAPEFQNLMNSIEKNYEPNSETMAKLQQSSDALAAVLNPQAPVSNDDAMRNVAIKQEEVIQRMIRLVVAQDSEGFYNLLIELIDETTLKKALGEEDNAKIIE